jgi:hypothetical protein
LLYGRTTGMDQPPDGGRLALSRPRKRTTQLHPLLRTQIPSPTHIPTGPVPPRLSCTTVRGLYCAKKKQSFWCQPVTSILLHVPRGGEPWTFHRCWCGFFFRLLWCRCTQYRRSQQSHRPSMTRKCSNMMKVNSPWSPTN